jgi:hypothetical protein
MTDNGVTVHFESCETTDGATSRIWRTKGIMTGTVVEGDGASGFIGGFLIPDVPLEVLIDVLSSPEATVAAALWQALVAHGLDPDAPAMIAMGANMAIYDAAPLEGANDSAFADMTPASQPTTDRDCGPCFGCCGPRCFGCVGCVTDECTDHDACVCAWGYFAVKCMAMLPAAIDSAACCLIQHQPC